LFSGSEQPIASPYTLTARHSKVEVTKITWSLVSIDKGKRGSNKLYHSLSHKHFRALDKMAVRCLDGVSARSDSWILFWKWLRCFCRTMLL